MTSSSSISIALLTFLLLTPAHAAETPANVKKTDSAKNRLLHVFKAEKGTFTPLLREAFLDYASEQARASL
ncbi:MAG: hypothetical protein QGF00_24390, partial [Planctomycetota bacterium]|nr:hypothetical protein [Planctomycetota bacterium]